MKIKQNLLFSLLKVLTEVIDLEDKALTAWQGYPIPETREEELEDKRLQSKLKEIEDFRERLITQIGCAWIDFGKDKLPKFSDSDLRYFGFPNEVYAKNWMELIRNTIDWEESAKLYYWFYFEDRNE